MRKRRPSGIVLSFIVGFALISSSLPAAADSHQIKQGDTLWSIAAKHHTSVAKLVKANHISENGVLPLGKVLTIPGAPARAAKSSHAPKAAKTVATNQGEPYSVHISASSASLRVQASTASRRAATLSSGTTLKVLSKSGKWAKVATSSGACGYVYRALLSPGAGSAKPDDAASAAQPDRSSRSLIQTALACRGASYRRGGTSRGGFDCSGFTRYVFAKYGVSLPHSSAAQAGAGRSVSRDELQAGDLVFFQTSSRGISHVGIYIGGGNFVHAASRGRGVTVDSLSSAYYAPRYRGARRVS